MMRSNPEAVRRMLQRMLQQGVFPERPVIRRFVVEAINDYSGDPAYYITVLLDDATPEEELVLETLRPIERLVFDKVFRGPEERWPYVRIVRESDQFVAVEDE